MDNPATAVEVVEKFEEGKERGLPFHCDLYDTEIVRKIGQMFLPGLASACVDNTSGDIFKMPASVAVDIRTEMVDYLTQRSESFIAESVILESDTGPEASDHPYDILSDFVDDYASSKRNLFSRVSGWLLSDKREDKIDDVVQEMEKNGFWLMDKREAVAQILLKNVDFKKEFHCDMKFNTAEELPEHIVSCGFRPMNCTNEGCTAIFCASQMEKHDSVCPFKIILCEQKCPERLLRLEMDKHCITVCPMKLVNCPFYAVGCESSIPYCQIEKHRLEDVHSHVLYILQGIYKGVSVEDLNKRVQQLQDLNPGRLADARTSRSLTNAVKDLDAKLGPLEISVKEVEKDAEDEESKGVEAILEPSEISNTTKEVDKEAEENENVKGHEAKLESSEVSTENKEAEKEVDNDQNKDRELKLVTSEFSTENKDVEKLVEDDQVKNLEAKLVDSLDITTVNKEAENNEQVNNLEPKLGPSESDISTANKEAEKETDNDQVVKDHKPEFGPSEVSITNEVQKQTENGQERERTKTEAEPPSFSKTEDSKEKEERETLNSKDTKENDQAKESTETSSKDENEHHQVEEKPEASSEKERDDDKEEASKHGEEETHRSEAKNLTDRNQV